MGVMAMVGSKIKYDTTKLIAEEATGDYAVTFGNKPTGCTNCKKDECGGCIGMF